MRVSKLLSPALLGALVCASSSCSPAAGGLPASGPSPFSTAREPAAPAVVSLQSAETAFRKSQYALAERQYRHLVAAGAPADVGLARVLVATGRGKLAESALAAHGKHPEAQLILAGVLSRRGQIDEAASLLEAVVASETATPDALRSARLGLGELELLRGHRHSGQKLLMTLVDEFNDDQLKDSDALGLARVGRAAFLLKSPEDANDAFNRAELVSDAPARVLLWRAELFLDKHDPGHAEEVVNDLLKRAPEHPEALVYLAQIRLIQALRFDQAEALVSRALSTNPKLARGHLVLAGLALRDLDINKADAHADDGLRWEPKNLELLSMKAAIRFLADDPEGFEVAKAHVLMLSPNYSRLFQIVGEYAEWEHRYEKIVELMREAVFVDSTDAHAYAKLGVNLIRSGAEADGLRALGRAFSRDPFNTRVFNTLNLYEKVIAKEYESVAGRRFHFRYHRKERAILERYVPKMLNQAFDRFVERYNFRPKNPTYIELYAKRESFAVRTSGLPHTAIQGVCFGRTVASMSPATETFNLGMTLWHELAHVFHIQQSLHHVPRWFTEGLAEYETIIARPEWRRELDLPLYRALLQGRVPHLRDLNRAFTHADDMADVATAYYTASVVVKMLGESHGPKKLSRMMTLWGQGLPTAEVCQQALGQSLDQIDTQFRAYMRERTKRFEGQFVPLDRAPELKVAKAASQASPQDKKLLRALALAAVRATKLTLAELTASKLLKLAPRDPDALWIRVLIQVREKNAKQAGVELEKLLASGADGFLVQMMRAEIAQQRKQQSVAVLAWRSAHIFDPLAERPLRSLAQLATAKKDKTEAISLLSKLVKIDQSDAVSYRTLMALLLEAKRPQEAASLGEAAVYLDMEGMSTHRLYGTALESLGRRREALFEWESALLCRGDVAEKAEVHRLLAKLLSQLGRPQDAAKQLKAAESLPQGAAPIGPI